LVLALEADAEVFLDGIVIIQRRWKWFKSESVNTEG
jgi:hypothetical protein